MQVNAQLNSNGLGAAVEVFSTTAGFTHHGLPLMAAFNPAFTVTSRGTMLAFAEGRLGSSHDLAPKTVLMNRSADLGRTWEGMRALTSPICHFGPRPYLFEREGRETVGVLFVTSPYGLDQEYADVPRWLGQLGVDPAGVRPHAACLVNRLVSQDDGETWRQEVLVGEDDPFLGFAEQGLWPAVCDITGTVETIGAGSFAGRRVAAILTLGTPLDGRPDPLPGSHLGSERLGSSILYSDDGESWRLGGVIADRRGNEAAAAPAGPKQTLVMLRRPNGFREEDLRRYDRVVAYRQIHQSDDGGKSWSAPIFPEGLPCLKQGGRRYDFQIMPSLLAIGDTLLTATPSACDPETGRTMRAHGVIGFSDDLGLTWRHKLIDAGEFSYATLGRAGNDRLAVIFSRGSHGERGGFFRTFTLDWLREAGPHVFDTPGAEEAGLKRQPNASSDHVSTRHGE